MKNLARALLAAGLFSSAAHAVSLTPSIQYFDLKPGESVTSEVVVANTDDEQITVSPMTKNWFVLPANKAFKSNDWLKLDPTSFVLKPGETKKLQFTAKAPKKSEGELVGMLSFRTKSPTRTTVEFIMSAAVYVTVKGTEKMSGDIVAMMVQPSTGSVQAGIVLRNKGNVHLRPVGILEIYDANNQLILNVELEKGQPTYPGNQRAYMGLVKDYRMAPGKYTAKIELTDMDREKLIEKRSQTFRVSEDLKVHF